MDRNAAAADNAAGESIEVDPASASLPTVGGVDVTMTLLLLLGVELDCTCMLLLPLPLLKRRDLRLPPGVSGEDGELSIMLPALVPSVPLRGRSGVLIVPSTGAATLPRYSGI